MGYRFEHTPPPDPEQFLPRFEMRNGTVIDLAFPCFYLDVITEHDSKYHDHIGRPDPTHRDCICQYPGSGYEWIDFDNPHPIDLMSDAEGYDEATAVFDEDIDGVTVSAWIEGNIVYMRIASMIEDTGSSPISGKFTLFVHSAAGEYEGTSRRERLDQVIRGMIVILPGKPIPPSTSDIPSSTSDAEEDNE